MHIDNFNKKVCRKARSFIIFKGEYDKSSVINQTGDFDAVSFMISDQKIKGRHEIFSNEALTSYLIQAGDVHH